MLVYCVHPEFYLLVVNAANTDKDYAYIQSPEGRVRDHPRQSLGPLQPDRPPGPEGHPDPPAADRRPPGPDEILHLRLRQGRWARNASSPGRATRARTASRSTPSTPIPARSGTRSSRAGKPLGLQPVGLGARDTLRLEAKLPLYGNDIDDTTTPLEADFKWIVKFKKGDFLGRDVLVSQNEQGITRKLVGFELVDRGIARPHYPDLRRTARPAGQVASGTFSPLLQEEHRPRSICRSTRPPSARNSRSASGTRRPGPSSSRRRSTNEIIESRRRNPSHVSPEFLLHQRPRMGRRSRATSPSIGITDFAQKHLGDVVYVELPAVGKALGRPSDDRHDRIGQGRLRGLLARSRARSSR